MNEIKEKFLPIGTVCMLKDGTHPVMIIGYLPIPNNSPNEKYDYTACLYPEGLLKTDQVAVFNHDQIVEVLNMGYESEKSKEFIGKLKGLIT